ncbi:YcfA family protein [Crinalium epipsammum PCC 9333]|uniref:YcfA family protein n=1 Tax=Crinalium epipsammum PCC 9333 TaxID=1173022 RepID=K9VX07_9CYAN|nr:YcfA family protein [Crinalium epipsammum PCC 9333]
MPKIPALTGKEIIRLLERIDFQVIRQKGSHVRMRLTIKANINAFNENILDSFFIK